ncbi:MAG TPA: cupredoxin family copper-binding protein [Solirubrobacterales bacterium]
MRTKLLLTSTFLLLVFAFASCGGDDKADTAAGDESAATTSPTSVGNAAAPSGEAVRAAKVEIIDFAYDPDPVTIQAGGKVIWTNRDSAPHTATAEDGRFDTGTIAEGKIKSETFKDPGTYAYLCEIHPTMHGTVEVVEKG